jgi:PAS domain S-box-containing protein
MTACTPRSREEVLAENLDLRTRLQDAEQTLVAIRNGEVDALVIAGPRGDQVFTLQGADHSFRVLVEQMSQGALTVAADGMILYSNPRFADMTGQASEKVQGSRLAEYVVAADRLLLDALLREGFNGRSEGALHLLTTAGRTAPVYFASSRMSMGGTDPVALCIVITDLTQQERNHAIVASERLARSILDQAGEAIVVCDPDGIVVRASRQAFKLCGVNPLRQQFAAAFPLWIQEPAEQSGTQVQREKAEHPLSLTGVADGDQVLAVKGRLRRETSDLPVAVLVSAVALRGGLDELLGFVITLTDVGPLEAAIKELEAFSYSVAHDLRSPLRAVGGFSRILLDEYAPQMADEAQGYLRLVSDSARHMNQLVDGLLEFSRLGCQPLQKESVLLIPLVRQVLAELATEHAGRKLEISIGDLPACRGDPLLLKQLFVNLLSNAIKFTGQRAIGHIAIGWHGVGGEVVYFVKDDGAGFNRQYAHKLFGVFQRLHRAEDYAGTGVGLAIAQRIVRRHGGRIGADGVVGHGATFSFTLGRAPVNAAEWPVARQQAPAPESIGFDISPPEASMAVMEYNVTDILPWTVARSSIATVVPVPKPLRVLFVEDRPSDAILEVHLLVQAGFAPEWRRVETESEYLAHLDPAPDIILADYTLPQFSGLEALRLLRERGLAIPFILITGVAGEEAAVSALHLGADDYLLKDRLARLGQAVTRALERYTLRQETQRSELALLHQERTGRAEAEAAVRMRDEFVAIASHELRTPVTVIKATAQVLLRLINSGDLKSTLAIDRLQTVNVMSDRLKVLIADLLDVSRLRTGRLQLQPELLDLATLAREVVNEQRLQAGSACPLELSTVGVLPPLRADAFRMRQVFSNLVENAIKYSPTGTEVNVHLREQDLGVLVTVSDLGIGLPPGAAQNIFEPFGRASNATRQQLPGMGLGLYIARQIVEQHGGRIWADSPGEGLGTRVNAWLPGVASHPELERPSRVLVVDDEASIRSTLGDLFALEGYDCRLAANGREALSILSGWGADLIVLDLTMPIMDGWTFRREQQAEPNVRDIPVVVISARQSHDVRDAELAPAAVLAKPFDLNELVNTVHDVLSVSSR